MERGRTESRDPILAGIISGPSPTTAVVDLLGTIYPGAERPVASCGENDAADIIIMAKAVPQAMEFIDHPGIERVEDFGSVERDGGHCSRLR